jgi:hypothetical protein
MEAFKNQFDSGRKSLSFFNALSPIWKGIFPLIYVVPMSIVKSNSLFDAHTVITNEAAEEMRSLFNKRKRGTEDEGAVQGRASTSGGASGSATVRNPGAAGSESGNM